MITQVATYTVSKPCEANYRDEQHDAAHNTVECICMSQVGSNQFPSTHYVTPYGSISGHAHPLCSLCLCGEKGGNLDYDMTRKAYPLDSSDEVWPVGAPSLTLMDDAAPHLMMMRPSLLLGET